MAEGSVQSVVQWLGKLLVEEEENLGGIKQKVEQLRDELDWLQCYLREADTCRNVDPRISRWVIQIQEIAYEAEDIVESFLAKVLSHKNQHHLSKTSALKNAFESYLWVVKEAKAIHDANNGLEALRGKVSTLTSRLQGYGVGITRSEFSSSTSNQHGVNEVKDDENFVGLDDKVNRIVGELVDKASENKVFGFWGKNGVGKTTLVRNVYRHHAVRKQFDRFVWLNVMDCKTVSLLRGLLCSLAKVSWDEIEVKSEQALVKELYDVLLEKKCLVVLDDVCSKEIWDVLKEALPGDDEHGSTSKFLFITHSKQVAQQLYEGSIIREVRCLSYDESLELVQSKLRGYPAQIFGTDGTQRMMEMAKKMLKSCQGVPLAVAAVGGLLATRKTPEEWKLLLDVIISDHIVKNREEPYEKVLELCYYSLPYYLKNCFLFLGSFPENYEIHVKRLCRMWVAEGIVVLGTGNVLRDGSLEDFAEQCLSELLQRGLVQVAERGSTGKIKSCKLHKIMRELCLEVSKQESFVSILDKYSNEVIGKSRRVAVYLGDEGEEIPLLQKVPFLRSLLMFPSQKERPEVNNLSIKSLCKDSPLLRLMDLEGVVISSKTLPREIGDLLYLRYLSLRDMPLTRVPATIGSSRWLETLDLRAKVRLEIPNVLWRLKRLRHLYLPCYFTVKDSEKLRLHNLEELLTLKNANHFLTEDVLSMKYLRRASVRYNSENEHLEFIQKSPAAVFSLTIFQAVIGEGQVNVLRNCQNLIKLELKGGLSAPLNKLIFPPNMRKLLLDFCGLLEDPMPVLEKLPSLASLCLDHQAYMGTTMICSASGFPQLNYLRLNGLKTLEEWQVKGGAMPRLLHLEVKCCERLTQIPQGLPQKALISHE